MLSASALPRVRRKPAAPSAATTSTIVKQTHCEFLPWFRVCVRARARAL